MSDAEFGLPRELSLGVYQRLPPPQTLRAAY